MIKEHNPYWHIYVQKNSLFECHRSIDQPIDILLYFYLVVKRFMITKSSMVEIKILLVNHES